MPRGVPIGILALTVLAGLVLAAFDDRLTSTAILCIQPIAFFGPAVAFLALLATDHRFRGYFTRPLAHRANWLRIVALTAAMLFLSLLVFGWAISDPTGELEAASVLWGYPLPWLSTGYFYAGVAGEFIRSNGGMLYVFQKTPWYEHSRILPQGISFDTAFYFLAAIVLFHIRKRGIPPRPKGREAAQHL